MSPSNESLRRVALVASQVTYSPGWPATVLSIHEIKTHCELCRSREVCITIGLAAEVMQALDNTFAGQTRLRRGDTLFRAGDPFSALYAIRLGSFKTTIVTEDGRDQITGFHMFGDIIGLDGILSEHHACEAVALEDTEVCALPFEQLEELARTFPPLQHNLHHLLSRDIGRVQSMMITLGSRRAEERLAEFLINLSERYTRRGYSSTEFVLRMTRKEIGSYLGLKLETVSRLFSNFQEGGLLQALGRTVKILDLPALRQLAQCRT
jgi:CRP/FNR family transcriptional regulator, anaerobic regulatory protein